MNPAMKYLKIEDATLSYGDTAVRGVFRLESLVAYDARSAEAKERSVRHVKESLASELYGPLQRELHELQYLLAMLRPVNCYDTTGQSYLRAAEKCQELLELCKAE